MTRSLLDVFALIAAGLGVHWLPALARRQPLSWHLSSDAEWYAVLLLRVSDPTLFPRDTTPVDIRGFGEQALTTFLARIGFALAQDPRQWSVAVSFISLALFLTALYVSVRLTGTRCHALIVALGSILPVHALGGATFGFSPAGYLPRDAVLGAAVLLLGAYAWSTQHRPHALPAVLLGCGILANLYPPLFTHLAVTLLCAELLRTRRVSQTLVISGLVFLAGAVPALLDIFGRGSRAPDDWEVLRIRMGYQMITSPAQALQYLRRTLVYAAVASALSVLLLRTRPSDRGESRPITAWTALAVTSLTLSLIGVYFESATPLQRYLLSRTNVFFILAAMVLCVQGMERLVASAFGPSRAWLGLAAAAAIFAAQSTVPAYASILRAAAAVSAERADFIEAAQQVRSATRSADTVMAPSEEVLDLAASLRTYAERSVYVSYKDIGVVQVDGTRGRAFYERWRAMQDVYRAGNLDALARFMRTEDIRAALVRIRTPAGEAAVPIPTPGESPLTVTFRNQRYAVLVAQGP